MTPEEARNVVLGEWRATEDEAVAGQLLQLIDAMPVEEDLRPPAVRYSFFLGALLTLIHFLPLTLLMLWAGPWAWIGAMIALWATMTRYTLRRCLPRPGDTLGVWLKRCHIQPRALVRLAGWFWLLLVIGGAIILALVGNVMSVFDAAAAHAFQGLMVTDLLTAAILVIFLSVFALVFSGEEKGSRAMALRRIPVLLRWARRPTPVALEEAVRVLCVKKWGGRGRWTEFVKRLDDTYAQKPALPAMVQNMSDQEWSVRLRAQMYLFRLGGPALDPLARLVERLFFEFRDNVIRVMREIAADSVNELAPWAGALVCPHCLLRPTAQKIKLPQGTLNYWGCRGCRNTREWLEAPGGVTAVLDRGMAKGREVREGELRVNALKQESIFDFDRVRVIDADDYAIERFCIAVGNDTDPARVARYRAVPVSVDAAISEEALRLLRHTFPNVAVREVAHE